MWRCRSTQRFGSSSCNSKINLDQELLGKKGYIPGDSLFKEDTGVCGLDELPEGCGTDKLGSGLSLLRSCRVFFNSICPDNFSSVISPVTRSMIRTHSF